MKDNLFLKSVLTMSSKIVVHGNFDNPAFTNSFDVKTVLGRLLKVK